MENGNQIWGEDGLESPKHVEHPEMWTSCGNLCIVLVHFHIAV